MSSTPGPSSWSSGEQPNEGLPSAPPYAGPQGDPGHPQQRRGNGMAVAALVLGILAIVFFWTVFGGIVLGIIGLVLGIFGARRARGGMAPHRGMAITGAVLGAIGLIAGGLIIALGVSILNSHEFKNYSDCLQHAHSQSDRQQCVDDYKNDVKH
ncbi:DUF4190 domain-containing protein [Streptomyces montanisoli]|uniref:DUF4190 domain-containing protein n=1 Tax=Streptomyces montanisoli TaxID=2798581 RepID=UPI001FD73B73|nr:DUF4190 domain-containing protein [Streptomyces montanisoli]